MKIHIKCDTKDDLIKASTILIEAGLDIKADSNDLIITLYCKKWQLIDFLNQDTFTTFKYHSYSTKCHLKYEE